MRSTYSLLFIGLVIALFAIEASAQRPRSATVRNQTQQAKWELSELDASKNEVRRTPRPSIGPDIHGNSYYVGSANGGVWQTNGIQDGTSNTMMLPNGASRHSIVGDWNGDGNDTIALRGRTGSERVGNNETITVSSRKPNNRRSLIQQQVQTENRRFN